MPTSTPRKPSTAKKTASKKASGRPAAQRRTAPDAPSAPGFERPIPVPEDPNSKYAANAWLGSGTGGTEDLRVPSGQLCLVQLPGLQGLMAAGVLRNMDSLSALVDSKHIKKGKGSKKGKPAKPDEIDAMSLMNDPEALENVMHTVDRVVCHVVLQPRIEMTPNDITRRQSGVVYADMVDLIDKMFIFNRVVGGTRDLETFRSGLGEHVGGVEALAGVPEASE